MKLHRILLSATVVFASANFACAQHTADTLDTVKKNLSDDKAVLLDVREQAEWDAGRLKDARLVPLSELSAKNSDAKYVQQLGKAAPKAKIVYCHCRSGVRSLSAAEILKGLGYDVRPLKAGYEDLLGAGFEKATDEESKKK
jgi:rhodanese-related sulfurtransferase